MQIIDSFRIAEEIKKLRISRSMTQESFAQGIGYSRRQIIRLESNGTMNLDIINSIARFFNVSSLSILGF
jgi:transcriptional regulator with XRE-family HTH domain